MAAVPSTKIAGKTTTTAATTTTTLQELSSYRVIKDVIENKPTIAATTTTTIHTDADAAAATSTNNIKSGIFKLKSSASSSSISLKSERPSSLNLDIAFTSTHSVNNLCNMTTSNGSSKNSSTTNLAGSVGCNVDGGAGYFNSPLTSKTGTSTLSPSPSSTTSASSASSASFLPDMPQWKRDLIQRRKQNVARTLNAATTTMPYSSNNNSLGNGISCGKGGCGVTGTGNNRNTYTFPNSPTTTLPCSSSTCSPSASASTSPFMLSSLAGGNNMNIEQFTGTTATTAAANTGGVQGNTIKDFNIKSLSTSSLSSALVTLPMSGSSKLHARQTSNAIIGKMEPAIVQQELSSITKTNIPITTTTINTLIKEKSDKLLPGGQYTTMQQLQLEQQQQQSVTNTTKTKITTAKDTDHIKDHHQQQQQHNHNHQQHERSIKKVERKNVMEQEEQEQQEDQILKKKLNISYKTKEQQKHQKQQHAESEQDINDVVFHEPVKQTLIEVDLNEAEEGKEEEEEEKEQQIANYSQQNLVKPITLTTTTTKTHLTGCTQQQQQQLPQHQPRQQAVAYTTTTNAMTKQTVNTKSNIERISVRAVDMLCGEHEKVYMERNNSNSTAKQMNAYSNNSNSNSKSNNNNSNNKSNSRVSTSQSLIKCESDCAVVGIGLKISEKLQENQFIKNNHKKRQQQQQQQQTQQNNNINDANVNNVIKQQQQQNYLYLKSSQGKFLDNLPRNSGSSGLATISPAVKATTAVASSASSAAAIAANSSPSCFLSSNTFVAGGGGGGTIKNETGSLSNTKTVGVGVGAGAASSLSSSTNNCSFIYNPQKKKMVAIQEIKNTKQNTCGVVNGGVGNVDNIGNVGSGNNNSSSNMNGRLTMKSRTTMFGTGTVTVTETGNTNLQMNTIDEDFSYGPGIVSKLTCRYLSLALRESMEKERFNKDKLRRSTSLSTLLDKPDHDVVDDVDDEIDEMEEHKHLAEAGDDEHNGHADQLIHKNNYNNNNNTNNQTANNQIITGRDLKTVNISNVGSSTQNQTNITENTYLKGYSQQQRQQQQNSFIQVKASPTATNNLNRSRHFKRGNDSMKRARSVEALLCEQPSWQQRCISTITNANCHITIENKIHNARERLHQGTDYMPPRRLQSVIDDTERPPPDLVKQTLRLFEATANRRPRLLMHGDRRGDVASKVETFKNIIKEQKIANYPRTAPSTNLSGGGIVSPVKSCAANFTTPPMNKPFTDLQQQQQQQLSSPSPLSKVSSSNQSTAATAVTVAATTTTPPHLPSNNNINKNNKNVLLSDQTSDLISRFNSTQRTTMVEVDSPVTALSKQMEKLHLNDNANKQAITATLQQQREQQLHRTGQENSANSELRRSGSDGGGGGDDAYHSTADMNNKQFINNTTTITGVAAGIIHNKEKCEMNNENENENNEEEQQQRQWQRQQQQGHRQLVVGHIKDSDNDNVSSVGVDIDVDVDFTTNKALVNNNSSLAVAGEGIKVHNKRSISSSTINNAKLINTIKTTTSATTTTTERLHDKTIVNEKQINVNDNKLTAAANNNKNINRSEQYDQKKETEVNAKLKQEIDNIKEAKKENEDDEQEGEEAERDLEENIDYGEFRRITRTALDNIAKAGTTQQFKFSTDSKTTTPAIITTTTTASGKQVGVIRPLLNTTHQHTVTTVAAFTTTATAISTTSSTLSSSSLSGFKKSSTIISNNSKISETIATPTATATNAAATNAASGDMMMMDALKHSPLKVISKTTVTTGTTSSMPSLTTREIEKNRINELKKTNAPLTSSYSSIPSSNISPSLDTVINTQMIKSPAATAISHAATAIGGDSDVDAVISATNSPLWAMRKRRQTPPPPPVENTTMVFNFSNRKEVPDYIENDGVIFRRRREIPKPNESGFVLLGDLNVETSNDMDYDDFSMCPPSPCDVEFVNANVVIDGKSSIKKKSKEATFHVQFNDTLTSTFEYPSEASLVLDADMDDYDTSFLDTDDSYHALNSDITDDGEIDDDHAFNTTFQKLNLKQPQSVTMLKSDVKGESGGARSLQSQNQNQKQYHHHHHVAVDEIIELPSTARTATSTSSPSSSQLHSSSTTTAGSANSSTAANETMNRTITNNSSTIKTASGTKNFLGNLPMGSAPLGLYTPVKAPLEKYFQLGITRASPSSSSSSSSSSSLSSSTINQSMNNILEDNHNPVHAQRNLLINGVNANNSSNKIDGNGSIVGITDGLAYTAVNRDHDVIAKVAAITDAAQQQSPDSLPYIKPGDDDLNIVYSEGTQKADLLY